MKKFKKLIFGVCLTSVSIMLASSSVLAAELERKSTTADIEFTPGTLNLTAAPVIKFGSHPIVAEGTTYTATSITPALQVTDARGSFTGWNVSVKASHFKVGADPSLDGATIRLEGGIVASTAGTSENFAPVTEEAITVPTTDALVPVLEAQANKGMGLWEAEWANTGVFLDILGGTAKTGANSSTLEWVLSDAP
jgi:hypothetical protein